MKAWWRRFMPRLTALAWSYAADSLRGRRKENQDNYLLLTPTGNAQYLLNERPTTVSVPNWSSRFYRLAIADGMGGHAHGREVAQSLIETLLTLPAQTKFQATALRQQLLAIHQQLYRQYTQDQGQHSGSTLLMADICRFTGKFILAHIGDSRAYLIRANGLQALTFDHTLAEFDWREAVAHQASLPYPVPEKTHRLAQAMGFGSYGLIMEQGYRPRQFNTQLRLDLATELPPAAQTHADIQIGQLKSKETLLLASDGLWSGQHFDWLALAKPELTLEQYLHRLTQAAFDHNSQDNISAVLLRHL